MTLEELLNKLIEKGWDVFPDKKFFGNKDKLRFSKGKKCVWFGNDDYTLRELTSKESFLWQFCVDNGMVNGVDRWTLNAKQKSIYDKYITSEKEYTPKMNYEYRLIESALKNEDELERFLLDNIKVEGH